ncbi:MULTISPECIES: hypothetical protein [Yersinia]|uniref:Uncharacterized protein n=1 Tax=Yersinia hibernica TaxID=2339259 RepID=A0ABX5R3T0_9GAMM|nr:MULTISPECIES: hypothetical protein [Yersinia]MCB5303587.1 hypothetical protein [Yersinia bercovieri]QAX80312.1 hypothetical protein D5F51_18295 [Yersinia hibernica]HEN3613545.1 hypothetical protein [Yersinia enterocolitica]
MVIIIRSFLVEYRRLRMLGFSRLEATGLVLVDPAGASLRVLWHVCIVTPLFMVGALTVGLWLFLPAARVGEVISVCIGDAGLRTQLGCILLLASAVLEGGRYVWRMNDSLLSQLSKGEGYDKVGLKDKQR